MTNQTINDHVRGQMEALARLRERQLLREHWIEQEQQLLATPPRWWQRVWRALWTR